MASAFTHVAAGGCKRKKSIGLGDQPEECGGGHSNGESEADLFCVVRGIGLCEVMYKHREVAIGSSIL